MIHLLHYSLTEVEPYIHWLYFFHAWGFPARYGSVAQVHRCPSCRAQWVRSFPLGEQAKASEAYRLFDDAQTMLQQMTPFFGTHALVGLFPANSEGEDIVLYDAPHHTTRLPLLRQQQGEHCLCWADFVLPASSSKRDTVGLFATSVDEGLERQFPDDDYRRLLCQTLADRLAEATAERMHEQVRRHLWGYAPNENLTPVEMFQEKYTGRRPAVGYPSLPDQSLNFLISDLIGMPNIGIHLTESGAMRPHASTSGLLIAHPQASHFAVGPVGSDQLADYARRRHMPLAAVRRFLAANLSS